jgi:hypothetical protein
MTTTHTHTSGPWTIEAPSKGCAFPIIHGGDDYAELAIVYSGDADKRLIASAPEMLEALRNLTHPMASDEDLQHALAVIAKAEGRAEP